VVEYAYNPNYAGSINRRFMMQAGLGLNVRLYSKNNTKGLDHGSSGRVPA
jgi:hypothetical protein